MLNNEMKIENVECKIVKIHTPYDSNTSRNNTILKKHLKNSATLGFERFPILKLFNTLRKLEL